MDQSISTTLTDARQLLADKLNHFVNFDNNTRSTLVNLFYERSLEKGSHYAKAGGYPKTVGFNLGGVLRAYFITKEGDHYNKTLFTKGDFFGAYSSLVTGEQNLINIQCLTNVVMLECKYDQIVALYDRYPTVERFSRRLAEQYFARKETREIQLATMDAKERYKLFKKRYPELEQHIPQYHIASYLGITPTQLSRVRADL